MNWLVVVLILLVAFGPVLWLMPSRRDRVLTRMRARARALGVLVELVQYADPDPPPEARVSAGGRVRHPTISGSAYRLALPRRADLAPAWSIARGPAEGPAGLEGWQWASEPAGNGDYWAPLRGILDRAPRDVFAAEAAPGSVSLIWRERVGEEDAETAVENLVSVLREVAAYQQSCHAARETELERQRTGDDRSGDPES